MKRVLLAAVFLASLLQGAPVCCQEDELSSYLRNLPFPAPEICVPVFSDRSVSVVDHGAVGDGQTLNTEAFARAIEACAAAGGGTVLVPSGLWLTGPIRLRSGINLHVSRGGVVLFSERFEDNPLIAGFDGTSRRYRCVPLVSAYQEANIAITGDGMFDGRGDAWRPVKKEKLTAGQWKALVNSGGVVTPDGRMWYPSQAAMEGEALLKTLDARKGSTREEFARAREFLRPVMVQFDECRGILIDGPTFVNSPSFHVQPVQSENIVIRNVTVRTEWWAQNGDGIDLSSCRNVLVYRCVVDAGDDALCIKPGTISKRQNPGPACENIVIADCIVYRGHGGFVIGSESYGGARNIAVRNCTFHGTDIGLRFKSARGRGGVVENIFIDGIVMTGILREAILFDMSYDASSGLASGVGGGESGEGGRVPQFRNFSIRNLHCSGAARALSIAGLEEMPVRNIRIENVTVRSARGVFCQDVEGLMLNNVSVTLSDGLLLDATRAAGLTWSGGAAPSGAGPVVRVEGVSSDKIRLIGFGLGGRVNAILLGPGVKSDAVSLE